MVLRLEETRFPDAAGGAEDGFDRAPTEAKIAGAFREYGIDLESLEPDEAAERIRARPIRHQLVMALDHWIKIRASAPERGLQAADPLLKRLIAVARDADPDEWRNQV